MQGAFAVLSGSLVGFSLGLIGGGGSILAVPLLLYLVGVADPHVAIGTSALAVSANAFVNLWPHARAGHVRWAGAGLFALIGVAGATLGSSLGKSLDGHKLLALFALLMLVIAVLMQRPHDTRRKLPEGNGTAARISGAGFAVGAVSGFFGIGGGFLIVPGLVFAAGMPIIDAIGSSLVAVGAFGLTTALNYALSGFVAWLIAAEYIAGGIAGGFAGARLAALLSRRRMLLNRVFGGVLVAVALYMLMRSPAVWHSFHV
jgi:uncharacterized membrane protein YfcA